MNKENPMSVTRTITRNLRVLTILFGVARLAAGPVLAQSEPHGYRHHDDGGMHQLQGVLESLNLTSDQQAAIDKVVAAHRDNAGAGMRDVMAAKRTLADRIHADTLDETSIRQAAAVVAGFEADRAVADAKMLNEIRAQLTAGQRTQLQQELSKREGMMEPMGPMGPMSPRTSDK
jgi:Spy/CpxP family protein refolding chaperone